MSAPGGALDWPLSRNEKKGHVLRLYDMDMRAANSLLQSGETALTALRQELHSLRATSIKDSSNSAPNSARSESTCGGRVRRWSAGGRAIENEGRCADSSIAVASQSVVEHAEVGVPESSALGAKNQIVDCSSPATDASPSESVELEAAMHPLAQAAEDADASREAQPRESLAACNELLANEPNGIAPSAQVDIREEVHATCEVADSVVACEAIEVAVPRDASKDEKTLCEASNTALAAERLQRAIAEATEALAALLGAAASENLEDDLNMRPEEIPNGYRLRARSEGNVRVMLSDKPIGSLKKSRRRRLSRGGEPLKVSFSKAENAYEPGGEPEVFAIEDGDPDSEPEPSPEVEAPSTPERSPRQPLLIPGWQRTLALVPAPTRSPARRGSGSCRLEYDGVSRDRDADEPVRGRRRERSSGVVPGRNLVAMTERSPKPKAPVTAMDFL